MHTATLYNTITYDTVICIKRVALYYNLQSHKERLKLLYTDVYSAGQLQDLAGDIAVADPGSHMIDCSLLYYTCLHFSV